VRHAPHSPQRTRGFTLIELLTAITIGALALSLIGVGSVRVYESIRFKESVRDVVRAFSAARYRAIQDGKPVDVEVDPDAREIRYGNKVVSLTSAVDMEITSAQEFNQPGVGVFRFYPEGGSSGGSVIIELEDRGSIAVTVDWLLGRIRHETLE